MVFEVFTFKTPKSPVSEGSEETIFSSKDEEEKFTQDLSKTNLDKEDVEVWELQKEKRVPELAVKNKGLKPKHEEGDSKT